MIGKIQILSRSQINDARWNETIRLASNSLPYGYTWYLDALCPRWIGIVVGDYDFIMPLPIARKWGLLYVYQPLFCQQLGLFYKRRSETIIQQVLSLALKKFLYVNLNANYDNTSPTLSKLKPKEKANFTLRLDVKHKDIQKNFGENTLRNIKKAQKEGLKVEVAKADLYDSFVDFYIKNTASRDKAFKLQHQDTLRKLVHQFIIHDCSTLYIVNDHEGKLCAGVIIIRSPTRLIHLLPASGDYARQHGVMQFLIDGIIQQHENSALLYDFEGSSVPTIAQFYKGFGAVNTPFLSLSKAPFKRG